jgi:hypothetical protein
MPPKIRISKPIQHRAFAKRPRLPATGKPKDSALDISLNGVKGSRIIQEHGLLRVLAEVSGDGLRRQRQYDQIPVIRLSPKKNRPEVGHATDSGIPPRRCSDDLRPQVCEADPPASPTEEKEVQRGGSIFERRTPRVPGKRGGIHDGPLQ